MVSVVLLLPVKDMPQGDTGKSYFQQSLICSKDRDRQAAGRCVCVCVWCDRNKRNLRELSAAIRPKTQKEAEVAPSASS